MPTAPSAFLLLGAPQAPGDQPPPDRGNSQGGRPLRPQEKSSYRDTPGQIRAAASTAGRSATRQLNQQKAAPVRSCASPSSRLLLPTHRVDYSQRLYPHWKSPLCIKNRDDTATLWQYPCPPTHMIILWLAADVVRSGCWFIVFKVLMLNAVMLTIWVWAPYLIFRTLGTNEVTSCWKTNNIKEYTFIYQQVNNKDI